MIALRDAIVQRALVNEAKPVLLCFCQIGLVRGKVSFANQGLETRWGRSKSGTAVERAGLAHGTPRSVLHL